MVKFWYMRVVSGKNTLDEVPKRWHDQVAKMLEENGRA